MKKSSNQNQHVRVGLLFFGLILFYLIIHLMLDSRTVIEEIKFSDLIASFEYDSANPKKIKEIVFQGNLISGERMDGTQFASYGPNDVEIRKQIQKHGISINYKPPEKPSLLKALFVNSVPILLLLGVFIFFMRQVQIGGGKAMSFGKSRAKLLHKDQKKVTFSDIAGVDEAKVELEEIVEFLKEPKRFTSLGGRIPKGVLLIGSPGTGKTLLAKAVAGEADVPFYSISGSDFVEMFVGVGASRVRDLFDQAKKNAPCLVFIDEIDAVGRHRGAGLGGGHDEREQTLNQLLVEMDGFASNEGVIIIAATNRPDVLDPALLRPGRFDRRVIVPKPDIKGRIGVLMVHSRKTPLAKDVKLTKIAQGTPGFSGADLESLVNEAALIAARAGKKSLSMEHFELAKDKLLMGPERKTMVMSDEEKRNTAYHEAGHAIVGLLVSHVDPVHKVSIIPRGQALGVTIMLPEVDRLTISEDYAKAMIAYAMGGRAAEMLILHQQTTGAGDDIKKATDIAKKMVCSWGMSKKLGPLAYGKEQTEVFLGRDFSQSPNYSEQTAKDIDDEIRRIVSTGYKLALKILEENIEKLENFSESLLVMETLDAKEMRRIMDGEIIVTEEERISYKKRLKKHQNFSSSLKEKPDHHNDNSGETVTSLKQPPPAEKVQKTT